MVARSSLRLLFAAVGLVVVLRTMPMCACCPAPPRNKPVVNADQTVIILWDAANQMQHFIRKATFQSEAQDFGFIVPSPTQPELDESGDEAFPYLFKLTEPEVKKVPRPINFGIGCGAVMDSRHAGVSASFRDSVKVLQEKEVAGFNAVVLEAKSATALITWLKEHDYAYSPEVEAWARPYVEAGWKFTALKIAKDSTKENKGVATAALRISFKTDRPLFPYREPDPKAHAEALGAKKRLLRIYFIAEARYRGELTRENPWTGEVAWSGRLKKEEHQKLLEILKLPADTGPSNWWLTEFEDNWPYRAAPADVYFSRDPNQQAVRRDPIIQYVQSAWPNDASLYALAAAMILPQVIRLSRRRKA